MILFDAREIGAEHHSRKEKNETTGQGLMSGSVLALERELGLPQYSPFAGSEDCSI